MMWAFVGTTQEPNNPILLPTHNPPPQAPIVSKWLELLLGWALIRLIPLLLQVTHNPDIECYADRILYLADGMFEKQAINVVQTKLIFEDYIKYLNSSGH